MIAASSSLSSPPPSSPRLHRRKAFRRPSSLPQIRTDRHPNPPRSISASYGSSAAERERQRTGGRYRYYSGSYGGRAGEAEAARASESAETLYDVLGLTAGATAQEIKAAFRRLARECHPDVAASGGRGASAEEFMRIRAAYATLSDPGQRAEYDRRMVAPALRRRPPFRCTPGFSSPSASSSSSSYYSSPASFDCSSSSGFARRTWETDQCW